MKLEQLERIYKTIEEIEAAVKEDTTGCYEISEALEKLKEAVSNEIDAIVTSNYWKTNWQRVHI